ncbi:hypothetical protein [Pseudomonas tohonis]|uniref:hypothetical protein n=1 Tax=Pseudomonas tohonis TaxID=2725477 RepID=UPI0022F0F997|nr:hypothetical protein [Pseudomonas tohonis]
MQVQKKIIHRAIKTMTSRYAPLVIFAVTLIAWELPCKEDIYKFAQTTPNITGLYPNIQRALSTPFADPKKISTSLIFLDATFTIWLFISTTYLPSYIAHNKILDRATRQKAADEVKLTIYFIFAITCGVIGAFWYDGKSTWPWGDLFHKEPFIYLLFITTACWTTFLCIFGLTAHLMKFFRKEN